MKKGVLFLIGRLPFVKRGQGLPYSSLIEVNVFILTFLQIVTNCPVIVTLERIKGKTGFRSLMAG